MTYQEKVDDFLAQKVIAIAGVSRNPQGHIGNFIFKKFKDSTYRVYPVNPAAEEIEGEKCFKDIKSIPEKVEAVFVATNAKDSANVVRQCLEADIKKIWFHKAFGAGNYTDETIKLCKEYNIDAIFSGCPAMHLNADFGHKCFKFIMKVTGGLK
jgi:hypothetical protein